MTIETVQSFFNAYTAHDVAEMLKLCSPQSTFRYVPLGESGVGSVHGAAAQLWQLYMDAFPDFRTEIVSIINCGETIVCETLNSGAQAKEIGNLQNKNRSIAVPHLFIFEFEQEFIHKIIAFWDNDTIYAQLGHTQAHD